MENLKSVGIEYISNRTVTEGDAVMFDIDDTLRQKLKKYKAKITYTPVKELDTRKEEIEDIVEPYMGENDEGLKERAMEIGRSSFEMDEFQTAYLRLKMQ